MSDDPQRGNPLETAPIPTLLLRYSVPTALTLMVNFLYNIVDQIFIGRGVGISGMTATNITFPLVILVGAVSLLLGDGCAASVSLALGRRQQAEAAAAVGQTVTLLLVSGIVLAALSALLPGLEMDGAFIRVDRRMQTNLPGVFAAGDCTGLPLQVAKAVGEGCVAAISAATA